MNVEKHTVVVKLRCPVFSIGVRVRLLFYSSLLRHTGAVVQSGRPDTVTHPFSFNRCYTEYAGLEISDNSRIAWPFSWHIAKGNAGPTTALDSMGPKPTFRCHFVNIGPSYKQ